MTLGAPPVMAGSGGPGGGRGPGPAAGAGPRTGGAGAVGRAGLGTTVEGAGCAGRAGAVRGSGARGCSVVLPCARQVPAVSASAPASATRQPSALCRMMRAEEAPLASDMAVALCRSLVVCALRGDLFDLVAGKKLAGLRFARHVTGADGRRERNRQQGKISRSH